MISIVMDAGEIPHGTRVRKPTGQKLFTLGKAFPVYHTADQMQVHIHADLRYLVSEASVEVILPSLKLAVDFDSPDDAVEFLHMMG